MGRSKRELTLRNENRTARLDEQDAGGGVVWQTVHHLLGFQRLGYDIYYAEAHAHTPSMLMEREDDDSGKAAAAFIASVMRRFGLGDRWAYHALYADGRCYGLSEGQLS